MNVNSQKLRDIIDARGIVATKWCAKHGIKYSTFMGLLDRESGSLDTCRRIAEALGVDMSEFVPDYKPLVLSEGKDYQKEYFKLLEQVAELSKENLALTVQNRKLEEQIIELKKKLPKLVEA